MYIYNICTYNIGYISCQNYFTKAEYLCKNTSITIHEILDKIHAYLYLC